MEVNRLGPAVNGIEPEYTRPYVCPVWYHRQLQLLRLPSTAVSSATIDPHGVYGRPPYIALEKG